ncbi:hypothetical protein FisN_1Lh708 [Fistulifera solaris]|uniref:Cwf19-like C-terminal domain-containing protein n=1 Tax=Fistulifera solaris TaxID=1519565 RepID=A0A1Z5KK16_FISSO|nr:hypothetical protein FisN_1Lh708 [Fistulifera solaris]|eukprot:GAX26465.1 hypothetical protein FisN_1Lh708 [Fistulifera solaris]
MSKIKILLFGPISDPESEKLFVSKINALHSSKAGPFDVAFVVGRSTIDSLKESNFPLPVYLHGLKGVQECDNIESLATNLHVLSTGVKSISIPNKADLIVATLPWNIRVDSQPDLMNHFKHASYTGCDLLFSHEWPQGIESCMNAATNTLMSFDVAHVALQARARYHVSVGESFQQSTAFDHLPSITHTTKTLHVGRFLSIAPIRNNSTKDTKYVHAVGIAPLHSMSTAELNEQRPAVVQPCPFTDTSYQKMNEPLNGKSAGANLSEASIRRIMNEERTRDQPQQHRWATKRSRNDDTPVEVDLNCTTLFVHGLHHDVSGRLQLAESGDPLMQNAFSKFNLQSIRRPANSSSFCFLEFATHEQAERCLEQCGGKVRVEGVELTLKWGSSSAKTSNADSKRQRLTESEAKDSSTVYFKLPPSVSDVKLTCEILRKWMEKTLEDALAGPDDTEKVTAETEPALRVQARLPQDRAFFGFMDFASHAAASMALATLTGSTDGGRLLTDATAKPSQDLDGLYLHWAKADTREDDIIEDSSGFRFERQHFPADSRKDCWFCLASEDCEKHLITGVYDLCYSAMPKGPVHPGHVLLIPVHHSSKGAFADPAVAEEIESTKRMLREHASRAYDMNLFVFERAIETIHGYHTHVQCVPVERGLGAKLQATMMAQAKKIGVNLRELSSDLNLKAVITDDDDSFGYFYLEVPDSRHTYKRFLYKHNADSDVRIPLQFGREILAAVLGKPQLAHWKSCVLDRNQEAALAASLRMSLKNGKQSEHEE